MDKLTKFINTCMDDIVALVIIVFSLSIIAFTTCSSEILSLLGTWVGAVIVFYFKNSEAKRTNGSSSEPKP